MATNPDKPRQSSMQPSSAEGTPRSRRRRKGRTDKHREEAVGGASGSTPEDVRHERVAGSDKDEVVLFARHEGKVFKAVYVPTSMRDFMKDRKWCWSEVGDVDETVWDKLRDYKPSAGATTPGKPPETPQPTSSSLESASLKDSHVLHLSHRITSEQELRDLGTKGFKLEKSIIDNALFDHSTSIQGAAHEVLHRWVNMQTRGRDVAYVNLLAALGKCQMNQLAAYLRELVEGTEDAPQVTQGNSLQDEHILELSKRIPDPNKLMDLGIKVLMFEEDTIKAAMFDHSDSIQAATHELLSKWLSQQPSRQEAYIHLQAGLKRAQMNHLASNLRIWVEGPAEESQVTDGNSLQDEDILELSKRIPDGNELMEFGIKVLAFPENTIKAAMYDHRDSIQAATHKLLSKWLKQQPSRQEAYMNLQAGLKRAQMHQLASNLRIWVEGTDVISQMIDERIADLQSRIKDSLERNCKDCLKHDWLEEGLTFSLMQYYTELSWAKMVKEAMGRQQKSMKGMEELLEIPGAGQKCIKILVEARAGMGKSSSMAYLAMKWVNDENKEFPFDFVFLIPLRNVDKNCSLAKLVADEHDLEKEDIPLLQNLLQGKTKHKVLLLLDGYDEYTPGTNTELDRAIEITVGKCFLILTSRPKEDKDFTQKIKKKMDGEVVIEGFSVENIWKCCSRYLGSEEAEKFLEEATKRTSLFELLKVPIMLLMTSVLYNEDDKKSLPERRTELYENLNEFLMDRSTLKQNNYGCYSSEVPNLQDMLQTLGKFSWEALQRDVRQLYIEKAALEQECPDIMKLGLLHVVGVRKATARKQPAYLSFEHKSLQEFGASKFVTKRLETSENMNVGLDLDL